VHGAELLVSLIVRWRDFTHFMEPELSLQN